MAIGSADWSIRGGFAAVDESGRGPAPLGDRGANLPDEFGRNDFGGRGYAAGARYAEDDQSPDLRLAYRCGAERSAGDIVGNADTGQDRPAVPAEHQQFL